jgi:hypothetical protein
MDAHTLMLAELGIALGFALALVVGRMAR